MIATVARFAALLVALLSLSACYYTSTADLRPEMIRYRLDAAVPAGKRLYVSQDGKSMLELQISEAAIEARLQQGGSSPDSTNFVAMLGSERMLPANTFLAMSIGGTNKEGQRLYQYFAFQFSQTHVSWIRPSSTTTVAGLAEMGQKVTADMRAGRSVVFMQVAQADEASVRARFADLRRKAEAENAAKREREKAKKAPPVASAPTPSPAPTPSASNENTSRANVKGYVIGDGVYVQGTFSDQAGRIQDIDTGRGRVKVLRYSDGISEWVDASRIITRQESTTNDIARGVGMLGIMVCITNPDACAKR